MGLVRACLISLALFFLFTPAAAESRTAKSVESYYQQYLRLPAQSAPNGHSYRETYRRLELYAWVLPGEEQLAHSVAAEIDTMLLSCGIAPSLTSNLERNINYPFAVRERLRGSLPERLVWIAACHGLTRGIDDPQALFMTPEEWNGIPSCGGGYTGPPQRPSYPPSM